MMCEAVGKLEGASINTPVSDIGLDKSEHLLSGLGDLNKDTVVDLEKAEELEGLALLGVDLVDTLDADDEDEAGLLRDVV